jgi:hypothetical protein
MVLKEAGNVMAATVGIPKVSMVHVEFVTAK